MIYQLSVKMVDISVLGGMLINVLFLSDRSLKNGINKDGVYVQGMNNNAIFAIYIKKEEKWQQHP